MPHRREIIEALEQSIAVWIADLEEAMMQDAPRRQVEHTVIGMKQALQSIARMHHGHAGVGPEND